MVMLGLGNAETRADGNVPDRGGDGTAIDGLVEDGAMYAGRGCSAGMPFVMSIPIRPHS